jgi:small subunit ribosomal protein S16
MGKTKQPGYRLIVSEKKRDTQYGALEILGNFNPRDKKMALNTERIKYWLSKGAQASNTVFNLLLKEGLVTGKKRKSVFLSTQRKAQLDKKVGV